MMSPTNPDGPLRGRLRGRNFEFSQVRWIRTGLLSPLPSGNNSLLLKMAIYSEFSH